MIVTELVALHPLESVTVTEYVVVATGDAVGFEAVVELSPVPGAHAYVNDPVPPLPVGAPPSIVLEPLQIAVLDPASATTAGFMVNVI